MALMRLLLLAVMLNAQWSMLNGQIQIGGNVYGGGNKGNVNGSATVTMRSGDVKKVFGGARQANVGGNAYVNIDGKHASGYMVIDYVFGGNDISGTIGTAKAVGEPLPAELVGNKDGVDDTWNTYVHLSTKTDAYGNAASDNQKVFIGQAFAGGNGDYTYTDDNDQPLKDSDGNYIVKEGDETVATSDKAFNLPDLDKTYIDVQGGTIAFAHGGGNNVTVKEKAVIRVDNPSEVVTHVFVDKSTWLEDKTATEETDAVKDLLNDDRIKNDMGIKMAQEHIESSDFQVGRFFGGNNKADMSIMPTWHLQSGKIRNLYSGGNKGAMTCPAGLLLEIDPEVPDDVTGYAAQQAIKNKLIIDNVYGGCRMANVRPTVNGVYTPCKNLTLANYPDVGITKDYSFPPELSARVLVRGGDVRNVFGGNDVTGTVYGGNAVGIYTSIRGNVYGGGNGAYAYTNTESMKDNDTYGDFSYYDFAEQNGFNNSIDALNAFRPNAEQVSIRLAGTSAAHPTIIKGSVFVGGNCASLDTKKPYPMVELKIGSHVIADKVFLGNNGEDMISEETLTLYATESFSNFKLKSDPTQFSGYMDGVAMSLKPQVVFDSESKGDPATYIDYSTQIGSFYGGGNRGSMTYEGVNTLNLDKKVIVFDKLVGGSNNANVEEGTYNAAYEGGLTGNPDATTGNKLVMNLSGLRLMPKRWKVQRDTEDYSRMLPDEHGDYTYIPDANGNSQLEWNVISAATRKEINPDDYTPEKYYMDRRLVGGNVYGGCCESGYVNGNVVVNIDGTIVDRDGTYGVFATATPTSGDPDILYDHEDYTVSERRSGVILDEQGMDVLGEALTVYGGGKGKGTEIWGSSTVNINHGYCFQVFGGSESGVIGKYTGKTTDPDGTYDAATRTYAFNGKKYVYAPAYSTYVNLKGLDPGSPRTGEDNSDTPDVEFIYGGSFEGPIIGDVRVNLDNGRLFNLFAGSCNADILGHTESYIGLNGFPYLRDHIYGGNDLGGKILGVGNFTSHVREETRDMVHAADIDNGTGTATKGDDIKDVLQANAYVEYRKGNTKSIFGGCFGDYDYNKEFTAENGYSIPQMHNAFVNIRPDKYSENQIEKVFGAGEGAPGVRDGDKSQNRSYVLIDIDDDQDNFASTEVFGSGSNNGLGMRYTPTATFEDNFGERATAVIDLLHGKINTAYGGSYNEGITRRTLINVPAQSTIKLQNIFGGAYGTQILPPCDVYESNVNYNNTSEQARVAGAIYGGNNNERRTLYTHVNISSPVWQDKDNGYTATIYGAGRGIDTWSEYTEVNLNSGARVYKVFGGGEMGHVLNAESVQKYMQLYKDGPSPQIGSQDPNWNQRYESWTKAWEDAWTLGDYFKPNTTDWNTYAANPYTNESRVTARPELDDKTAAQLAGEKKYNTHVIIREGASVDGYAYGGGFGNKSSERTGDVYGTTYIALLGGTVSKDIYAAGQAGGLDNLFGAEDFTASANAYIRGGMVRNVYGGGYEGHVGYHVGDITADFSGDRPAESYVVIGKTGTNTFTGGAPAIQRNAYGGGEGGSVYGSSKLTLNNGYIGYRYKNTGTTTSPKYEYVPELDDAKPNDLDESGNVFGGGYVINSYVDNTTIDLYGGIVRGSVYGGGEVGPIGRGTMKNPTSYTTGFLNGDARIFKAGKTQVNMFDGHVLRNVFGGGRGHDNWGGDGTKYMDQALVATLDMKPKGYVFGQTEVNIYGGEVGTNEGMLLGFGNVFGGGDEGTVYSGTGVKSGKRYDGDKEGYYYNNGKYTEDCKVLIEPHCYSTAPTMKIGTTTYKAGDYVPTSALNTLKNKTTDAAYWDNLDADGIIIHNAVFAGGNIAAGSTSVNANETTVFGNATASIHDVYNRDLITIGTGHTGGLYGDGNLTFVDGYRELNITNYGTDYYHIDHELTYDIYEGLPEREKAYYELKYKCLVACTDIEGTSYSVNAELPLDELLALFITEDGKSLLSGSDSIIVTVAGKKVPNEKIWKANGVVTNYAGRIMNTIQRADFCGVFGSRMVMKGARDRVPEEVDYTNYTINRVREVSLNKVDSKAGDTDPDNILHGNYFGIYNTVNFLGALTSDVDFHSVRTTKANTTNDPTLAADGKTFYQWKSVNIDNKKRNNGTCHNHLALASGVSLELTTEKSTGKSLNEKDWGPITGVVELDLINVQPGIGGGFVYAKNQHGVPTTQTDNNTTLTTLNVGAVTQKGYTYSTTEDNTNQKEWETSGNFIHSSQTILDDCYNITNKYMGTDKVPAHYWYISGSVYVYDQYISAYTGSSNAFSQTAELPITIAAAAHGTMTLMDVRPSLYAYYSSYTSNTQNVKLGTDQKMVIGDVTYQLNDPINFWDWNKLTAAEKKRFVAETYVLKDSCKIGNNFYPAGYVMLPDEYTRLSGNATKVDLTPTDGVDNEVPAVLRATVDAGGNPVVATDNNGNNVYIAVDDAFRSSNNMSHDTGYLLTYEVTNPAVWGQWFTKIDSSTGEKQLNDASGYEDAPTYRLKSSITGGKVLGQREYTVSEIIPKKVYDDYTGLGANKPTEKQATFVPAYIVTSEYMSADKHYYPGAAVSAAISGYTAPAFVCTSTIKLSDTEYIYVNELMTEEQKENLKTKYSALSSEIDDLIVPAYYCTVAGLYGGDYYESGKNYRALAAWSAMSEDDRENFEFNYDALDLLIDPAYGKKADGTQQAQGKKYQYDGLPYDFDVSTATAVQKDNMIYSLSKPIDYTATYHGISDETAHNGVTLTNGIEYSRENYEKLPNEQRHYAAINVTEAGDYYVVNTDFIHVETPYTVGTTLSSEAYGNLTTEEKAHITTLTFTADQVKTDNSGKTIPYYYCREEYKIGENTEGVEPTPLTITGATGGGIETRDQAKWVKVGTIIAGNSSGTDVGYESLKNYQKNFTIHGQSPMETSTLYVSRNSDIDDLRKEKVITVIYKYDYEESDADGMHITPVSERHVVNIHIKFESGVPTIPDIHEPDIVLPGTSVIIRAPLPTPGAYEITGGGWELYEKPSDAESHTNGVPYTPSVTPLYWYQDEFYLAYYAKTMLGKTYSNHVPVHVANYHDLKKVMDDKENHLHIDYDRTRLKRDSKIYINDYSESSENGLDLFKDLYDLSLMTTAPATGTRLEGHALLNNSEDTGINKYDEKTYKKGVKAGNNLDFFLRTDIDHGPTPDPDHEGQTISHPWTPIASGVNEPCFQGTLHGDGHTISGLAPADGTTGSLFGRLCGSVYNLGVSGSFTGAGVADEGDGYVESCWVKTSATSGIPTGTKAVFGDPTATSGQQVVNCYYPESNSGYSTGNAIQKPDRAFYNGELAYDLNNFYLYKRYSDKMVAAGDGKVRYRYFTVGTDNKLVLEEDYKYYESHPDLCSSGYIDNEHIGLAYVEDRFDDGDFRYAAGEIPTTEDERFHLETVTGEGGKTTTEPHFYPIWPDDYIFFGQKLTYGYSATQPHQDVPTAVVRENGRLATSELANRVYRAPAYYRSKQMGVTHFNPNVYLAAKSADGTQVAYPGMTAIDFAGHNGTNEFTGTYGLGTVSSLFYPPLLDDDGLLSITNCDETKNLLVYAPAETAESGYANKATYDVLNAYFTEPAYTNFYVNTDGYRLVGDAMGEDVNGHLVQNSLKATNDHLLVDRQDFNAPIGYSLDGSRMWYQRKPADNEFVDRTKGWQGISLPFTAELVTTNQKGEITHFYSGSKSSENGTGKKIGHEYWLRKYAGITTEGSVSTADFTYPSSSDGSAVMNKKDDDAVTNTFLWKYYYEKFSRQDENSDTYQDYYSNARTYNNYPLATANKPYLLGLPGLTYYEFDLSGKFIPQHTAGDIDKLEKQVVTFASKPNISIEVSDDKTAGVTFGNYTFKPNYLNNPELAANYHAFLLNDDGDRYIEDMTATTAEVTAFRPYFTAPAVRGSREGTRSIVFSNNGDNLSHETYEAQDPGSLSILAAKHKIVVTSTLKYTTDVRIVNTAGQVLDKFAIKPGETIETRIQNAGVFIVQDEEGKYIKKLAVE